MHLKNIINGITFDLFLFIIFNLSAGHIISQIIPGQVYHDPTGYVEYRAGNLPIIISAPHGGNLKPNSIPDRDCTGCVYVKDGWTKEIAEGMDAAFFEQTGCYPHVIINLLHRTKFDANRDIGDAADGNFTVQQAWYGYHAFIDSAKNQVVEDYERGLFLDLHGHGHFIQRIELGYLMSAEDLRLSYSELNSSTITEESSIRSLIGDNLQSLKHATLLRGQESFGTLLDTKNFPTVPSTSDPFPLIGASYFSGGYNTKRHGSSDSEIGIDAIQVELNTDIRFDTAIREMLIDSLVLTANQYINLHYKDQYSSEHCDLISSTFKNNSEFEIKIYPNPASDYIRIETELEDIHVSIFNLLCQNVLSENWRNQEIDVKHLKSGFYIIKIRKDKFDVGIWNFNKQ